KQISSGVESQRIGWRGSLLDGTPNRKEIASVPPLDAIGPAGNQVFAVWTERQTTNATIDFPAEADNGLGGITEGVGWDSMRKFKHTRHSDVQIVRANQTPTIGANGNRTTFGRQSTWHPNWRSRTDVNHLRNPRFVGHDHLSLVRRVKIGCNG